MNNYRHRHRHKVASPIPRCGAHNSHPQSGSTNHRVHLLHHGAISARLAPAGSNSALTNALHHRGT